MPCGLDFIVQNTRRLVESEGEGEDNALVSVNVHNAFNRFWRQRMINLLQTKVPSLCRFLNMVYALQMPSLILPAASTQDIPSQEWMQQADPASMLMFSLVVHPLAKEIAE